MTVSSNLNILALQLQDASSSLDFLQKAAMIYVTSPSLVQLSIDLLFTFTVTSFKALLGTTFYGPSGVRQGGQSRVIMGNYILEPVGLSVLFQ
jgi:hypothetical protein